MRTKTLLTVGAVAMAITPFSSATILTFDIDGISDFADIDDNYGDNVGAMSMGPFAYAVGSEGFTPDVTVNYVRSPADLDLRTTGYGDLTNVLFENETGLGQVEFMAAPGTQVTMFGFDMAAYTNTFDQDPIINSVSITNQNGDVLFMVEDIAISALTHTNFDFGAGLTGDIITINWDVTNLGDDGRDIGLDNIRFGQQPIPAPGVLALLAIGGVASRRRRRD